MMAQLITWLMVAYFLAVHGIYLMLTLLAARALYRNQRYREIEALPVSYSLLSPPISVLVLSVQPSMRPCKARPLT